MGKEFNRKKEIQTMLYETACASGTAAVALWYANEKVNTTKITIQQPSNSFIAATVKKRNNTLINVSIDGPIAIIKNERGNK